MTFKTKMTPVASAVAMALSAVAMAMAPGVASAGKTAGTYMTGDFHNHSTCSDGSTSMQTKIKKSTDKVETPWGLDWFVQAGHGGNGNRNCTLVEDETVATPAYPFIEGVGPNTTWAATIGAAAVKGNASNGTPLSAQANPRMWRWQSVQEFQYPVAEYLTALKGVPTFLGVESVVSGHEHTSMGVITGQLPKSLDNVSLPSGPGYTPLGNANALSQWTYCFDRGDTDNSRGGGQGWECSVPGSMNAADPNWNATAAKLTNNSGLNGHLKTVEGIKWMAAYHPKASYYVPAHLERAGPFNPNGSNGFNIEHLRNMNNAGPMVAFGFESQPGHGASSDRGEYRPNRNNFGNGVRRDSVGGTTWGGTGVYAAQIGGVWDALLGEGRNWWFFASSDWHNRGDFGTHDVRTTQDFWPGEYQRDFVMVRTGADKMRPQTIVDGLRSGNSFAASGQLVDRVAFVACASYKGFGFRSDAAVEALATAAAMSNTDTDVAGCATMGEKLKVRPGAEVVVAIVVRDPSGINFSPYSFANPSLAQVGINQPLNAPVLDHVDVIRGMVTGYKQSGSADYAGEWPDQWIQNPDMARVPAAAKNTTAALYKTFNESTWATASGNPEYKTMVFRIPAVSASQYIRLRGTNLPAGVPYETDANGNPLSDVYTNDSADNRAVAPMTIPCTVTGSNVPANGVTHTVNDGKIDGCPNHLAVVDGQKMVSYDVAGWADLWFYSNPIFIEVAKSTTVAGVK
ncbi:hypothetical protein NMQ14_15275 [Methyloversatilis sp. XJ19-13]|uniref:hypothetical protein n=1 Tax=Methyloversatilis sp. XJ19-13 TaxID=2963430 RepID=UPI00211B9E38|nr:hypothetical protein [Methyloversatilis sp. XJ19-13]MCQ9375613.1 hypothetical protein [Methyloversatilis sp. XJ19-13]